MGQDQPEALGRVFEVLAGGLGGAAYRRFGGRVQAGTESKQIHRAPRSDGAHVVSSRACDASATEGVAPLAGDTDWAQWLHRTTRWCLRTTITPASDSRLLVPNCSFPGRVGS